MKKQSRILIITNLLLLLGYLNWSIYQKEQTLRDGQLVLFEQIGRASCRERV